LNSSKDAQLSKKLAYLQGFSYCVGNYHVLGFSGGFGYSRLFLRMPINKIRTQKNSITSGRMSTIRTASLVSIRIWQQQRKTLSLLKDKPMVRRALQVMKDPLHSSEMRSTTSMQKLRNKMHNK